MRLEDLKTRKKSHIEAFPDWVTEWLTHAHPARDGLRGDEERHPAQHHEDGGGNVGLDDVVANLSGQVELELRIFDKLCSAQSEAEAEADLSWSCIGV